MSLIRQVWLLLLGMVLLSFIGSFGVWVLSARGYLETELRLKNSDNAQSLALTVSQQHGDPALIELAIAAQFDTGYYRSIRLRTVDGRVLMERVAAVDNLGDVPAWFVRLAPIASQPGVAQVSDGWRALGTLEVVSQSSFAYAQLWRGAMHTAAWLVFSGLIAGLLASFGVRFIKRPLRATIEQAQALVERRFVTVPEPAVPELARLSRAMNAVVMRLKAVFEEQAVQVEQLRLQAHCDPVTGLANRRHFLGQFEAALQREDGPRAGTLLLVRVMHLRHLNRDVGHHGTDHILQALAARLEAWLRGLPDHGGGGASVLGRLNGADFALLLPHNGSVREQARAVSEYLRPACGELAGPVEVVVAGVGWQRGGAVQTLMSVADETLARAESRGAFAVEAAEEPVTPHAMQGEDEWRQRINLAVVERRARLMSFPLVDRAGKLLHRECPLRLQIDPDNGYDEAAYWLPLALRTGLTPATDELAVSMALELIAADGQARGVNVSPASLLDSGFVPRLAALLERAPTAAGLLWLEIPELAAIDRFELVRELCRQLRPLGVRVGLEHAGERLARIEHLFESGLDYVKLDAAVVHGAGEDEARAAHIRGTASMLHGLGLQVYAEGVALDRDAQALWACGVDGITGPVVAA
jgi:diguanylate cyclase (GGDEF)-like protein